MYAGALIICLAAPDQEASRRYYEALVFEAIEEVPGTRIVMRRGSVTLGLFTFLEGPMLNFRGVDAAELHAALMQAGVAGPGRAADYIAEDFDADADGRAWATEDPGGTAVLFDTNELETTEARRERALASAPRGFEQDLIDLGASADCRDAYRDAVLVRVAPGEGAD